MVYVISNIKERDPQADLQTQCNPDQNVIEILKCNSIQADVSMQEIMFKYHQKQSWEKFVLSKIETYHKGGITKMVWHWYSDRQNIHNAISRKRPIYVYKYKIKMALSIGRGRKNLTL